MHAEQTAQEKAVSEETIPQLLSQTGLYSDISSQTIAPDHLAYTPQYPLWSDGASKRRWIFLPEGTSIDAKNLHAWQFPVGTKFFKEFFLGERIETRLMQRRHSGWTFVTYVWDDDGKEARLAPEAGLPAWRPIQPGVAWDIPGQDDCLECHVSEEQPVLGFTALQLSPERDALAPNAEEKHGMDLHEFVRAGVIRHQDSLEVAAWVPRIEAATPRERALRGYLMANCGNCHSEQGPLADLDLFLDTPTVEDLANQEILERMTTRDPDWQMPPLATHLIDSLAVELLQEWRKQNTR